nr:protein kinase [Anaerolineaceae bacterium]
RLERYVAIKFIRPDAINNETFLIRFENEAKALAKLNHSNIVQVLDYGEYENAPYLVMEYIPGGTLKKKLGKPMPWDEAANLIIPIARTLEYTHKNNIIHRDVKPANFLMNAKGEPMLSDFGIAKVLERDSGLDLTGTGVGIGTPEYMAPEQGKGLTVDQRSDIYALGVVFFELITGQKPFRADTPMAVMLKHIADPLPSPRNFIPELPDPVSQILYKALAKEPDNRYRNMGELASALEKLLANKETLHRVSPQDYQATVSQPRQSQQAYSSQPVIQSAHTTPPQSYTQSKPKKKTPWGIIIAGVVGIFGCIAIFGIFYLGKNLFQTEETPTLTPVILSETPADPTETIFPTEQATETPIPKIDLFSENCSTGISLPVIKDWPTALCEDFSNSAIESFQLGETDDEYMVGALEIYDGILTWNAASKQPFFYEQRTGDWAEEFTSENLANTLISIDMRQLSGTADSSSGLVFRESHTDIAIEALYYFAINSSYGEYSLFILDDVNWTEIVTSYSPIINGVGEFNRLTIVAEGSSLSMYVNGELLEVVTDDLIPFGTAGIALDLAFESENAVYEYDNFYLQGIMP